MFEDELPAAIVALSVGDHVLQLRFAVGLMRLDPFNGGPDVGSVPLAQFQAHARPLVPLVFQDTGALQLSQPNPYFDLMHGCQTR